MTELGNQLRAVARNRRGRSTDEDSFADHIDEIAAEVDLAIIRADQVVPSAFSAAMRDVIHERFQHQLREGWDDQHDDAHEPGMLATAGACYAAWAAQEASKGKDDLRGWPFMRRVQIRMDTYIKEMWPWTAEWWKPKDPRRDLVRAGALIIAEIDRIDRKAAKI